MTDGKAGFDKMTYRGKPLLRDPNAKKALLTENFGMITINDPMVHVGYDPALPGSEQAVVLLSFPNDTTVEVRGDPHVVTQIVAMLDKQPLEYYE